MQASPSPAPRHQSAFPPENGPRSAAKLQRPFRPAPRHGKRWRHPGLALCISLWVGFALTGQVPDVRAQTAPTYRMSVHLDNVAHVVSGVMVVEPAPGDPRRPLPEWWFHLPPNRFAMPDTRGPRRQIEAIPFARNFGSDQSQDPLEPEGFSHGAIDILSIENGAGQPLSYSLADNPLIQTGYWSKNGLLQVHVGAGAERSVVIRFRTQLPNRYWDGWSELGVFLEHWYPVLADYHHGRWERNVFTPRPGYYQLAVSVDQPGRVVAGHAWEKAVDPEHPFQMPLDPKPLRSLPLTYFQLPVARVRHAYDVSVYSYYGAGNDRVGQLAVEITRAFLDFAADRYHLPPPASRIALIEGGEPAGDIRTTGNLIIIPPAYYRNNPVLDRVFLAQLSRAVAQIWFGETVWSDRDRQAWLHLGLPGFLALDFFHTLYGWDAGIHNIADWLKPRYREHFFEAPVREMIRSDEDAPLMISLSTYPHRRTALLALYNKAPLVIRSLSYVMGEETFRRGVNAFYFRNRYRTVTERTFAEDLSRVSGQSLDWFFRMWFEGTPQKVDFSVVSWEQEQMPSGEYRVRVRVRRQPDVPMPVEVVAYTQNGEGRSMRWEDSTSEATLVFVLPAPVVRVAIDPEEYWLEVDRKNNYSERTFRVRPLFDWAKQREVLMTLQGRLGGNAIDGNYAGLGIRIHLDEDNRLLLIPIYGDRTGLVNYQAIWERSHFLLPRLSIHLTLQKLGGSRLEGIGLGYDLIHEDDVQLRSGIGLQSETVEQITYAQNDHIITQPTSRVNNITLLQTADVVLAPYYISSTRLNIVHSQPSYDSRYDFTTYLLGWTHSLSLGANHSLQLVLTRGVTDGTPPLQKRHFLGGPELLRGYPRTTRLAFEEIAGMRLDYGLVFTRRIYGGTTQVRSIVGYLFGDVGKGWNNDQSLHDQPQRQDAGFGIRLDVNVLSMVQFPVRVDIAYPLHDEVYKKPQIILFGVFNF